MKNGIAAALLVVMAGLAHAGNAGTATIDRQMEIDAAMAPIQTPAQLAHHIRSVRDSPLDKLPPRARREFLDSLAFTPEGLGGFSHLPLASASLSVDEAYRILQLFGMQGMISSIPNLFPANETEIAILEVAVQPQASMPRWMNSVCIIHGRARECRPHYGYNCSKACDD